MAKKKVYAVAVGRKSGIFHDWSTTEQQVKGFPGAKYKSFKTEEDARRWLANPEISSGKVESSAKKKDQRTSLTPETPFEGITVYTDGGALHNPGPGGYGIVIVEDTKKQEMSGGYALTTNNRMELMAVIVALDTLKDTVKPITLYSDSSYVVNGVTKGWARKWQANNWNKSDGQKAMNVDLWEKLLSQLEKLEIQFHWVKGHAGNPGNERCDQLAVEASRKGGLPPDMGYENS